MTLVYVMSGGLMFVLIVLGILLIIGELEKQIDFYYQWKDRKKSDEFIKELEDMTDE